MTDPSRPPGPLRVARVLAGLQAAAGVLGLVLGGIGAMAASSADDTSPFQGIAVVLGALVAVAGLVTVVLVGGPLLVLRGATPTRRVTGRGLLVGGELLLLAPAVVVLVLRFGGVPTGTDPFSLAILVLLTVPVVVIGCLFAPSVRRWSYGPEFATT